MDRNKIFIALAIIILSVFNLALIIVISRRGSSTDSINCTSNSGSASALSPSMGQYILFNILPPVVLFHYVTMRRLTGHTAHSSSYYSFELQITTALSPSPPLQKPSEVESTVTWRANSTWTSRTVPYRSVKKGSSIHIKVSLGTCNFLTFGCCF